MENIFYAKVGLDNQSSVLKAYEHIREAWRELDSAVEELSKVGIDIHKLDIIPEALKENATVSESLRQKE